MLRSAMRAGSEHEVMNITVWGSFALIRATKLKVDQVSEMALFDPHTRFCCFEKLTSAPVG
jgi:hypothetical protein